MKPIVLPVLASALVAAAPALAASYQLRDGNSALLVTDRNGATVWNIDQGNADPHDAIDNLFLSNFYYRIGAAGPETNFLSGLGTPVAVATANSLSLTFTGASLGATVNWTLAGGAQGSGLSTITKSVSITNLGAGAIDLHLFDYSDYDINFDPRHQTDVAALVAPGRILTRSTGVPFQIDAQVTGSPDHHEITDFYTLYTQLFVDQDGPTTLPDTPAPGVGYPNPPGDNAFAFQWDRTLRAGETFAVSDVARYTPAAVPEPATWATMLAGFALAGVALRRRRRTALA